MPQPMVSPFSAAAPFVNGDYNTLIPRAIEYAELKMYRDPDLNFLVQRGVNSATGFTSGSRNFPIPGGILIVEELAAITPTGSAPAAGTRVQYTPVSLDYLNQVWPKEATTATPSTDGPGPWFAMRDNANAVVAPTPNANYTVEVTGIIRPAPLAQSAAATTYLTTYLPDLFAAASMIYWAGAMQNFGMQADNPKIAVSWMALYEDLKKGAAVESARQRSQGPGWAAYTPTSVATPARST